MPGVEVEARVVLDVDVDEVDVGVLGREGLGPLPSDLAVTYNEDQNLGVGVPYTRAAEFRVGYHPTEHWAIGVGIENSNPYIGTYVALPSQFTSIGSQFDNNSNAGAAGLMPDIADAAAQIGGINDNLCNEQSQARRAAD